MDSDDCIDAAFYEKLLGSAAETGAEVAKGSLRRFDPRSGRSWTEELVNQNEKIRRHKAHFYCYFTSALFQSDFLRKHDIRFPEELRYFEDPFFAVKAALHCGRIALVDDAATCTPSGLVPPPAPHRTAHSLRRRFRARTGFLTCWTRKGPTTSITGSCSASCWTFC